MARMPAVGRARELASFNDAIWPRLAVARFCGSVVGLNLVQVILNPVLHHPEAQHSEGLGGVEELEAVGAMKTIAGRLQFLLALNGVALAQDHAFTGFAIARSSRLNLLQGDALRIDDYVKYWGTVGHGDWFLINRAPNKSRGRSSGFPGAGGHSPRAFRACAWEVSSCSAPRPYRAAGSRGGQCSSGEPASCRPN